MTHKIQHLKISGFLLYSNKEKIQIECVILVITLNSIPLKALLLIKLLFVECLLLFSKCFTWDFAVNHHINAER